MDEDTAQMESPEHNCVNEYPDDLEFLTHFGFFWHCIMLNLEVFRHPTLGKLFQIKWDFTLTFLRVFWH